MAKGMNSAPRQRAPIIGKNLLGSKKVDVFKKTKQKGNKKKGK